MDSCGHHGRVMRSPHCSNQHHISFCLHIATTENTNKSAVLMCIKAPKGEKKAIQWTSNAVMNRISEGSSLGRGRGAHDLAGPAAPTDTPLETSPMKSQCTHPCLLKKFFFSFCCPMWHLLSFSSLFLFFFFLSLTLPVKCQRFAHGP